MFEDIGVFYRGLVLGLMVAAPVGPVGLLCIRRTVHKGLTTGFATGFGAAFADAMFSAIAAFGVAAILDMIRDYRALIHVFGGIFLMFVAWHTWHDAPRQPDPEAEDVKRQGIGSLAKALISGFVITLTNPATMFGVLALVATFGELHDHHEASVIVAGVFSGSAAWWLLLSGGVMLVRNRFTENRVTWINRITAVILAVIAVWAVASGAASFLNNWLLQHG